MDGSRTVTEIAALLDNTKGGHISEALAQLEEAGFVSSDVGTNPLTGAFHMRLKGSAAAVWSKCPCESRMRSRTARASRSSTTATGSRSPGVAIVSCNDGLRPVIMKLEATDEESKIACERQ